MGLKRREFLQRASIALAAMGVSEAGLLRWGDRYYQALAEPAQRKLALLVGINQYPAIRGGETPPLLGCLTDVELQRELLIHRFGFKEGDIITLTDASATRKNIEDAFVSHLSSQANEGDLVVFHFSGYGRRLNSETSPEGVQNSLMPVDGGNGDNMVVSDLLLETLWLLLRSLKTSRAIAVLDTSYTYPGTGLQGNLRIRSRPGTQTGQPEPSEFEFQTQLKTQPQLKPEIPGVVLVAAGENQLATEARWNGFSAGLFTYALTQQLWLATPATTLQFSLQRASCAVQQRAGQEQQPQLLNPLGRKENEEKNLLSSFLILDSSALGVVTAVEDDGKMAQLWLAGLPAPVLESYGVNSILKTVNRSSEGAPERQLQIRSREGLRAKAQVLGQPFQVQVGELVQESVRVLPRNIGLTVALDAGLERIERVDATSAFAGIPRIASAIAGEQAADYVFGRVWEVSLAQAPSSALLSIPQGSYGLFSVGKNLILNTVGEGGEAVKSAAQRLMPQLETLLAAKLLRLSSNEGSSRLGVRVTFEMVVPDERVLMQGETGCSRATHRGAPTTETDYGAIARNESSILTLPLGSRIRYRVQNYSDRPVYCLLFGLDSTGGAIALYPNQPPATAADTQPMLEMNLIAPSTTLTIPSPNPEEAWAIHGPAGIAETQLICSSSPFKQTFAALAGAMQPRADAQPIIRLRNPMAIAIAIMQDLKEASASAVTLAGISTDDWVLDVNAWATLSFIYRVV